MDKKYWRSVEEYKDLENSTEVESEISHKQDVLNLEENDYDLKASRRDFLKFFGFSLTAATLAASCERPIQKAIPYLIKPEEVTPGKANFYASTYFDGRDYCPVLVKVRDGRPIKIEGNNLSGLTGGGTSARVQASVLSLYDIARPQYPVKNGKQITWQQADVEIIPLLKQVKENKGKLVLLTGTIISPSTREIIKQFQAEYPETQWITYDGISASAILLASEANFGSRFIPSYKFQNADLVVGLNADFLGTWISPVEYTKNYISKRRLTDGQKSMSHHIHFESHFTITGSKADKRIPIKPSDEKLILANIYSKLLEKTGGSSVSVAASPVDVDFVVDKILANKNKTLVVSGSNDIECQLLVNAINAIAGSYGNTIDLTQPSYIRQGIDSEMEALIGDMNNGKVDGLVIYNANPAYTYGPSFADALKKVKLTISLNDKKDETSALVTYFCPDSHYLESWNDAQPVKGCYSLMQPTIQPLFNTRQAQDTFLKWMGKDQDFYSFLKEYWEDEMYKYSDKTAGTLMFWETTLQNGVFDIPVEDAKLTYKESSSLSSVLQNIKPGGNSLECYLYESIALGDGSLTNNPWLVEMPDPMTKVCWDNFVTVSPKFASEKGWTDGTEVIINNNFVLPVVVQPGQVYGAFAIALGFGHSEGGKVAKDLGVNVYPLVQKTNGTRIYHSTIQTIESTGLSKVLALSQMHHSMEGRPIVRESDLSEYIENPAAGNEMHAEFEKNHLTLYKDPKYDGYHWGLMVDLNACTSCGACIIACQAENNVPVVGKELVAKHRIMHWMRIDRYYSDEPENPKVMHQPVMCQHCDQAPCENVCPVSATNHSNEGINQIAYNRCIGTKYCINNCPYKVRRFNWFQYIENKNFPFNPNTDLSRMVLNPDVVVRERGVVEKCSFCIQRIQETKLTAKLENRGIIDGELETACVQACPASALVFGDLNNPDSKVSKMSKDPRNYHLLEELHTLPSVGYLTLIRNADEKQS